MQLSNAIVPIEEVTERLGYKTWEQALVRDLNVMQKNKARPFDFDMLNEFNEVMDPPPKRGYLLSRILAGDWENYYKGWIMALDGAVNYAQAHTKREGAFHVSSRYFRVDEHDPPLDIYLMPSTAISSDDLEGLAKIFPLRLPHTMQIRSPFAEYSRTTKLLPYEMDLFVCPPIHSASTLRG